MTKIIHVAVPRFLDVHPMKGLDGALLRELQNAHADEFGIIHLNIMYNPEVSPLEMADTDGIRDT